MLRPLWVWVLSVGCVLGSVVIGVPAALAQGSGGSDAKAEAEEDAEGAEDEGAEDGGDGAGDEASPKSLSETLSGVAKAEYEGAKVLYADGDYANAIVKFKTAYAESKDPRLLWNIAVCQKNLRQYSRMLTSIRRYREEGASTLTAAERRRADEIVETVQSFVSEMKLAVDQQEADVFVDDEKVATTPLANPLFLDVGKRRLVVKKSGFEDSVHELEVPGGSVMELSVVMVKDVRRGRLVVTAPEDALIRIDNQVVGKGSWEGTLPVGGHTLRVTADDKLAFQQEVVIANKEKRTVDVVLEDANDDVTATILWIVGGVSLAAAAGVTAAVVFEPASQPAVDGSINPGIVNLSAGGARGVGMTVWSW